MASEVREGKVISITAQSALPLKKLRVTQKETG
jgi:hypothetical protein